MPKMTFTSNQTANEYALYMIASSYFKKATCVTPIQEKKLKIAYLEQKTDNQYRMDENSIRYMEQLHNELPKAVWEQEVEAHLVGMKGGAATEIRFCGENFILRLVGTAKGKYFDIQNQIWVKKSPKKKEGKKVQRELAA